MDCEKRGAEYFQGKGYMDRLNLISLIALQNYVNVMDKLQHKTWIGYILMDAAMCRLQNPRLPYTDISRRFFNFITKKR